MPTDRGACGVESGGQKNETIDEGVPGPQVGGLLPAPRDRTSCDWRDPFRWDPVRARTPAEVVVMAQSSDGDISRNISNQVSREPKFRGSRPLSSPRGMMRSARVLGPLLSAEDP